MDPSEALTVTAWATTVAALAAVTSALITLAVLAESRASRIASRDTATVVARLRFSDDREDFEELHLENLGPAVARDVHLRIEYLDPTGRMVGGGDPISAAVLAPTPADRQVFLPALMLMPSEGTFPDLDKLADRGLKLRINLDWLDDRRRFPFWFVSSRQRAVTLVDLRAYRQSNLRALRIVDATLVSEVRKTRTMLERQARENAARESLRSIELPPDIQARVEAERVSAAMELWKARFRWWILRRRS